ncbi:MAG: TetR/AcrR family transcriptional regulator [Solobacterium sp.]|nr:TetR/AcrR family transcriptional regulator [Solobacterium sp.]
MAKRGETKETILTAAENLFFRNGFEKTSVKMILGEANVVTGSFYHFFPSKEALFEAVAERFLERYTGRMKEILSDDTAGIEVILDRILNEFRNTARQYFRVFSGDSLHWTVRLALHEKTLLSMMESLSELLGRKIKRGEIRPCINADEKTLAAILIKGSEAIIHQGSIAAPSRYQSEELRSSLMEFWKRIIDF